MGHPLDNMVWNALRGPQAGLGVGDDRAMRFERDVSMFAAVPEPLVSLDGLAGIIGDGLPTGLVAAAPLTMPPELEQLSIGEVLQLTAPQFRPVRTDGVVWRDLTVDDVPAMVDLVTLTRPGPFSRRTIEMGRYIGVFDGDRLIAMTGERLRLDGFGEVSAVCTHPDYQGRGLAKVLVSVVGSAIAARGEIPFLQAYTSNAPAIAAYQRVGFEPRCTLTFTILRRRPL